MRQRIHHDPAVKEFEAFMDFSGGLNTEDSNERLNDNEFPILENVDLSGRASCRRRTGRVQLARKAGNAQGAFFYHRKNANIPNIILAISGRLYLRRAGFEEPQEIPITHNGEPFTFQATLPVEAVQFGTVLYIATGTRLVQVEYDDVTFLFSAQTVEPYSPTVLEAIYIGTNALADNPDAYIQDGVTANLEVAGIKPQRRSGVVNTNNAMVAYVNKPASITSVDYKWEYKESSASTWTLGRDWTNGSSGKTWDFNVTAPGKYDIQVTVRNNASQSTTAKYVLANYQMNPVEDKHNDPYPFAGIQRCRRILLHWDRLIIYGDDYAPFQCYVSDLLNPRYFPTTNIINFDIGKQEAITAMVRFRSMLIVFTKTTVHTLLGKAPDGSEPYRRFLIHEGIGCVAPWSAKVVGNVVLFLSEDGIYSLIPNQYNLETLNVRRVDAQIKGEVLPTANACAVVHNSQYWLCFPERSVLYRFYYEQGMWVKDVSDKLNFQQFLQYGDDVFNLTTDGTLYIHDKEVFTDDGEIYVMDVESKLLDLSATFNQKKLKRLYVVAKHFVENIELFVYVYADSAAVLKPESGKVVIDGEGYVSWVQTVESNMHFYSGTTLGTWLLGYAPLGDIDLSVQRAIVRGKCRRVRVRFQHKQDTPCEIYGFGLEFKLKKP